METLHPELPGPEDRIVDFPEGKNTRFFWLDEIVFSTVVDWQTNASKDGMPAEGTYFVEAVRALDTHRTPIQKQPEMLLYGSIQLDSCPKSYKEAGASDQGTAALEMPSSEDVPTTVALGTGQAEEVAAVFPRYCCSRRPEVRECFLPCRGRVSGKCIPVGVRCYQWQYNVNLARQVSMGSQLRLRFEQEAKLLRKSVAQVARRDKRIQARKLEIKNLEALLEAETNTKKAAEDRSAGISQELENMQKLKAAFEEFKRQQDEWVEQRCAEMDARLDALSIDFDEELYPYMFTAIVSRRWVIGRGLRLVVMKCGESLELRQAFADAALKDLKYPLVDQLESLKDAPMDVIMTALYLESDTEDDASQDICDLRPSSSQLTIPVYPEVCDPRNPWACKEEIVLADAIAANISRAEKKKKCHIVCRTYGVGSAHHARSDGVPVSAPTVVPQGLALLLADAATQTELGDDT
nr:hypothetical protein [Tanacetum cinerariifolium]